MSIKERLIENVALGLVEIPLLILIIALDYGMLAIVDEALRFGFTDKERLILAVLVTILFKVGDRSKSK